MKHLPLILLLALCIGGDLGVARADEPTVTAFDSKVFVVTDYGAVPNGGGDASAAFQKALDVIARAGKGQLRIPAGDYHFRQVVSVTFAGSGLAIVGDGQGVSNLYSDNTNGVLRISVPQCKAQISLRDLSFLAAREGAGTAVEVTSQSRGARNFRSLTMENVDIRGAGLPTRNYFDYGVKAIAQWRPIFVNVVFSGVMDPALYKDRTDASPTFSAACGFVADLCYAPTFQHCYSWSAQTGYRVISDSGPEGPEDGAFYRCTANLVRVGFDISTPDVEPQMVIDFCHANARDVGIRLHRRKFFFLTNNLLYGLDHSDGFPYTDIELVDCNVGIIAHNIFQSPTAHNLKPTPVVKHTMIRADAKCHDLVISDNVFNAKGDTVIVSPGANHMEIRDNHISNPQAKTPNSSHE